MSEGSIMVMIKVISIGSERQLAEFEISPGDTIRSVKEGLHNIHPKLYPERVSLSNAPRGKNLTDDSTVSEVDLTDEKIYFKDLGPQVSWTTVFLTEYAGPLVCYLLLYCRPSIIYGSSKAAAANDKLQNVKIAMVCHTFHYAKRLFETVFVHRFSKATMPIFNIVKNSVYYWGFASWMAYFINHPLYTPVPDKYFYPALACFAFCELGNLSIHLTLRNLRPPGTKVRAIPQPTLNPFTWLFGVVSCPNYTYEVGAWISFSVMTGTVASGLFMLAGAYQMTVWALGKHRNYRKEFHDYPRARKAIFPFLI